MYNIEYILNKARNNEFTTTELEAINQAYKFALTAHDGQFRHNGDALIVHALNVAGIVADLNTDATTIIAALVHETTSKANVSLAVIQAKFGDEVAMIIDTIDKMSGLKLTDSDAVATLNMRKILVGLSKDVRVLIVKLANRLHDLRTADCLPSAIQKQKANETIEVLIPIAHRLGINAIKSELENLSLKYSKPEIYEEISDKLEQTFAGADDALARMKNTISDLLLNHHIEFQIKGRVKSIHSIYKKLTTGRKWSDIYDILGIRLLLQSEADCYQVVGLIHAKFRPIPKRFKDYIAMPKSNMYQSLHTSVFGNDGYLFEIQMRTPEMDAIAENGIAAHWSYKEKGVTVQNYFEQKLELFRNVIESQKDEANDDTFVKNLQAEFFSNQIYVFTPKGDVIELPQGSTPIDFAYRVHSEIGDKTVGAHVNDVMVSLNYELNDGDIIKINTNPSAKPSKDWLGIVKTSQAKNKIKAYFSRRDRKVYTERGKDLLEKEIRHQKLSLSETLNEPNIGKVLRELKLSEYEELLLNIGLFRYTPSYIINLISEEPQTVSDIMFNRINKRKGSSKSDFKKAILVAEQEDILVTLAGCCSPLPGDDIIGYITKENGVSVHRTSCYNVANMTNQPISVEWKVGAETMIFNSRLKIKTSSNKNNVLEIVTLANKFQISVNSIVESSPNGTDNYELTLKSKTRSDFNNFIDALKQLSYVIEVSQ